MNKFDQCILCKNQLLIIIIIFKTHAVFYVLNRNTFESLATFVQYKDILVIGLVGKSTFVTQNVEI